MCRSEVFTKSSQVCTFVVFVAGVTGMNKFKKRYMVKKKNQGERTKFYIKNLTVYNY